MAIINTVTPPANPKSKGQENFEKLPRGKVFAGCLPPEASRKEAASGVLQKFAVDTHVSALVWSAVRAAHAAAGITPEQFTKDLLNTNGLSPFQYFIRPDKFDPSANPYKQLEFQAWVKYLYYGGARDRGVGSVPRYADDQDVVMHYFGLETSYDTSTGTPQLKSKHSWFFDPVMKMRNALVHNSEASLEKLELVTLMYYYDCLVSCLKPLTETRWVRQQECIQIMNQLEWEFYDALGEVFYPVAELMAWRRMDAARQPDVERMLTAAGLNVTGGCVSVSGEIRTFAALMDTAWKYFSLSEASGVEQLIAGLYERKVAATGAEGILPADKPISVLENGNAEDWKELAHRYRTGTGGAYLDDSAAMKWYEKATEANPEDAQVRYELGQLYLTGTDEENTDPAKSLAQLYEAAQQGYAPAQVALGQRYETGIGVETRNWETALHWYQKAAEQSTPEGQYHLGRCYDIGIGTAADIRKAVSCYTMAAPGSDNAKVALGLCYFFGHGVAMDWNKAAELFREPAGRGVSYARYAMGRCYFSGRGVEKDQAKALELFQLAADAGNVQGQHFLGWCYAEGQGVERNTETALHWYRLAMKQGSISAQMRVAEYYTKAHAPMPEGKQFSDLTEAEKQAKWQTERGYKREAQRLYQDLADQGYAPAQTKLADLHQWSNYSVTVQEAMKLYNQAAQSGHVPAQLALAKLLMEGYRVEKKPELAEKWAKTAAENGSTEAMLLLAEWYDRDYLPDEDYKNFSHWLHKAADAGNADAQFYLAQFYDEYKYNMPYELCEYEWDDQKDEDITIYKIRPNPWEAVRYCTMAARNRHVGAQYCLAKMYRDGTCSLNQDFSKAVYWYDKAAEKGHRDAGILLGHWYLQGENVNRDPEKGLQYLERAAEGHCREAAFILVQVYAEGTLVEQNPQRAFLWLKKSEYADWDELGDYNGEIYDIIQEYSTGVFDTCREVRNGPQILLGSYYEQGFGTDKNPEAAYNCYVSASKNCSTYAMYEAGRCCEQGIGTQKNLQKAISWYLDAALGNEPRAERRLEELGVDEQTCNQGMELNPLRGLKLRALQ